MEKVRRVKPIILKGNINEIDFKYELKTKKDHKVALKDLKVLAGKLEKEVKDGSSVYNKINRYKIKTLELEKQTKQLEKQLKYTRDKCIIDNFKRMVREEIKNYKDWEIEDVITQSILNVDRYGGSFRRLVIKEVEDAIKEKKIQ